MLSVPSLTRWAKSACVLAQAAALIVALTISIAGTTHAARQEGFARLSGHIPAASRSAIALDPVSENSVITMALTLPLRNQAELTNLITRLYDPKNSEYGHFLSTEQFTDRFAPTETDYEAVIEYARSQGFKIIATHPNRTIVDIEAPAALVQRSFGVHLANYHGLDGHVFRAPDADPVVPSLIAGKLSGILGLDNASVRHPHLRELPMETGPVFNPFQIGSGPGGGLTPSDIKTAYNLNGLTETPSGIPLNGRHQTLALFELAGYSAADVVQYEAAYSLPGVTLQNILVDGANPNASNGADEVTLDIELMLALAPGVDQLVVYEGPNTGAGVVDTYNRIANDNIAKQVSTSWGLAELLDTSAEINGEYNAFQQMAAQGQTIYAASGDSGARDDGSTLSVDDPASQPFMTGVGATRLSVKADHTYNAETTWDVGAHSAGGGGVSQLWSKPSWQAGVGYSGSTRNVPDVSLDGDPNTGYSIFYNGGWRIYGGTSCAAPLWAAFTALVNQQRIADGHNTMGFINPTLYQIGNGPNYANAFHDINDGSNNQFYAATTGYDDATGWGSFNGANLITNLTGSAGSPPPAPTGLNATVVNGTQANLSWNASLGATGYPVSYATTSGGPYTFIGTIAGTAAGISGLSSGSTYFFVVQAANGSGTSGYSNEAQVTTSGAPPVPTGLTATAISVSQINLAWDASAGATSYIVLRSDTAGGPYTQIGTPATTSFSNVGLSGSTTYYYVVEATSSSGTSGDSSEAQATTLTPPPPAPSGLSATTVSASQINLSWSPSTGATSYIVYRGAATGGPYSQAGAPTGTSFSDTGLSASTTYYYVVRATNGAQSPNSGEAQATTLALAPTGLAATAISATQINLTWNAVAGAASYNVYRSLTTGGQYTKIANRTVANYNNTGLTASTTYFYVVTAMIGTTQTPNSAEAQATTHPLPTAPTGLTATAISASQINLTWNASAGAISYSVSRSTTSGGQYTQITTRTVPNFNNTGLAASTAYFYVVKVTTADGISLVSSEANATTQPVPPAPTGLAATAVSATQINLTWNASPGATGYTVYRSTTSGGLYSQIATRTVTNFNNTGLSPSTTYFYVVRATNGPASPNSGEAQATTHALPAAPTGLMATAAGPTQINLIWNTVPGATSYKVSRSATSGGPYTSISSRTVPNFSNTGLAHATTYFYVVTATTSDGTSPNSAEAQGTTGP